MVAQEIWIDVNNHVAGDIVTRIGEGNSRQIVFKPFYYNDAGEKVQVVIDSENIHGMFRMVKPDNTFVITDLSLYVPSSDPAIFIATMTPAMSQVAGRGYYDIRIGDTEDASEFLYSAQGNFIIDDDMITDSMIESVAEVNGYVFPDDFLTSADLEDYVTDEELTDALDDYVTDEELTDALANIDTKHNYSENEIVVGKWIDGRDVYEKTFDIGNLNSSTKLLAHGISNLNLVLNAHGSAYNGTSNLPIPYSPTDAGSCIGIAVNSTNIVIYSSGRSDYYAYVTIQYIKTV